MIGQGADMLWRARLTQMHQYLDCLPDIGQPRSRLGTFRHVGSSTSFGCLSVSGSLDGTAVPCQESMPLKRELIWVCPACRCRAVRRGASMIAGYGSDWDGGWWPSDWLDIRGRADVLGA